MLAMALDISWSSQPHYRAIIDSIYRLHFVAKEMQLRHLRDLPKEVKLVSGCKALWYEPTTFISITDDLWAYLGHSQELQGSAEDDDGEGGASLCIRVLSPPT